MTRFAAQCATRSSSSIAILSAFSSLLLTPAAHAQRTEPARLLPLMPSSDGSLGPARVTLDVDGVEELDIESTVMSGQQTISATKTAGMSFRRATPVKGAADGARMSSSMGMGREGPKGTIVELPPLHQVSFAPGVYFEYVKITVIVAGLQDPVDVSELRYFEVTRTGMHPISIEAYSERMEQVRTRPDGTKEGVGTFVRGPLRSTPVARGFDVAVRGPAAAPLARSVSQSTNDEQDEP